LGTKPDALTCHWDVYPKGGNNVMDFWDNIFDFYSSSSPHCQLHLRSLHPTDIFI
jgi:hypothetical protein